MTARLEVDATSRSSVWYRDFASVLDADTIYRVTLPIRDISRPEPGRARQDKENQHDPGEVARSAGPDARDRHRRRAQAEGGAGRRTGRHRRPRRTGRAHRGAR